MSKRNPSYETKSILGTVVLDPETKKKRIKVNHPAYYQHEVDQMPLNAPVQMIITTKKPIRSESQNNFLHLYFSLIALSSGHTMREIKNWAKGRILAKGITEVFGDKVRIVKDTSRLTVGEMIEFIGQIEAITGVPCPDPEPFNIGMSHEEFAILKEEQRQKYLKLSPDLSTE